MDERPCDPRSGLPIYRFWCTSWAGLAAGGCFGFVLGLYVALRGFDMSQAGMSAGAGPSRSSLELCTDAVVDILARPLFWMESDRPFDLLTIPTLLLPYATAGLLLAHGVRILWITTLRRRIRGG